MYIVLVIRIGNADAEIYWRMLRAVAAEAHKRAEGDHNWNGFYYFDLSFCLTVTEYIYMDDITACAPIYGDIYLYISVWFRDQLKPWLIMT